MVITVGYVVLLLMDYAAGQTPVTSYASIGSTTDFDISALPMSNRYSYILMHPDGSLLATISSIHRDTKNGCSFKGDTVQCPIRRNSDYGLYNLWPDQQTGSTSTVRTYHVMRPKKCPILHDPLHGTLDVGPDQTATYTCDAGYVINYTETNTTMTRFCEPNGYWSGIEPFCVLSDTSTVFPSETTTDTLVPTTPTTEPISVYVEVNEIKNKIESGDITILGALQRLNVTTKEAMLKENDVTHVTSLLNDIIDASILTPDNVTVTSTAFIDVTSNLIISKRLSAQHSKTEGNGGGEDVIGLVDSLMYKVLAVDSNSSLHINITTTELYVEAVYKNNCDQTIRFPAEGSRHFIESSCPKDQNITRYSGVLYQNIGQLISMTADNVTGKLLQPTVIALEQPGFKVKVKINIEVDKGFKDPVCVFLNFSSDKLSTEGCRLVSFVSGTVTCECDHLTNFAVLMSPIDIDVHTSTVLGVLTIVGCVISIICLLITIGIHIMFGRRISQNQDRTMLLIALCSELIVTYTMFLAGIDKTDNKAACTFVAVSLHFLLLTAFMLMLAEGVYHLKLVLKPRALQPSAKNLVIASIVFSAVFVSITAGSSQLAGYGTDKGCWLSTDTGIKWTFIIPAVLVILANAILTGLILWKINNLQGMDQKNSSEKIKKAIRDVLLLSCILGFTWIFGLFSFGEGAVVFQYIFVILNSLQGFFIMLVHCVMNKKVRSVVQTRSQRRKKHVEATDQSSKPSTSKTEMNTNTLQTLDTVNTAELNITSTQ